MALHDRKPRTCALSASIFGNSANRGGAGRNAQRVTLPETHSTRDVVPARPHRHIAGARAKPKRHMPRATILRDTAREQIHRTHKSTTYRSHLSMRGRPPARQGRRMGAASACGWEVSRHGEASRASVPDMQPLALSEEAAKLSTKAASANVARTRIPCGTLSSQRVKRTRRPDGRAPLI